MLLGISWLQVLSTTVNQDGRTANLTSPSGQAQQRVIRAALHLAGILTTQLSLVELHGTGTQLGDPIEVAAQHAVMEHRREHTSPLPLGAAKSNAGHLEACAGFVGLLKLTLSLTLNVATPNLHLCQINPFIDVCGFAVTLCTELGAVSTIAEMSLKMGVSSFGFGGTNSHALLSASSPEPEAASMCVHPLMQYQHSAFIWWNNSSTATAIEAMPMSSPALEGSSGTQWERTWPSATCRYNMAGDHIGHSQKIVSAGIVAMEYYAPNLCCSVADIEQLHNCPGRYTVGRGQQRIGFTSGDEDTVSMAMTVFEKLVERCELPLTQIGRLEVGSESQVDRAKSVKSFLMAFFQDEALHSVEGADTYNACYGGTNALFSTANWVESASWSKQYGVVVCSDPAVHPQPEALSGIGASAVGLMVGTEQVMMLEATQISFIKHSW